MNAEIGVGIGVSMVDAKSNCIRHVKICFSTCFFVAHICWCRCQVRTIRQLLKAVSSSALRHTHSVFAQQISLVFLFCLAGAYEIHWRISKRAPSSQSSWKIHRICSLLHSQSVRNSIQGRDAVCNLILKWNRWLLLGIRKNNGVNNPTT